MLAAQVVEVASTELRKAQEENSLAEALLDSLLGSFLEKECITPDLKGGLK